MPRQQDEQDLTHKAFLTEISKASNGLEILELYNQVQDDETQNEIETIASDQAMITTLIARKDAIITSLTEQLRKRNKPGSPTGLHTRRWN